MPILTPNSKIRVPLQTFFHNWKVELGTEDVTSDKMSLDFTSRSLRYGIGNFTILLWNNKGMYNSKANIGTNVNFYFHHDTTTPTNKIFTGKIDRALDGLTNDNLFYMIIQGRDFPQLADKKITISFTNAQADNAIKSIIDTYYTGVFTYANLSASMTDLVNGDYTDQKVITIIGDILKQVEYDGYIDGNRDIHTYPDGGSNVNETESIVYGINMLPFSGFGRDGLSEFNEVKCYGDQSDDMILFRRKIDSASITESWIKTAIVNARSLFTPSSVAARADAELIDLKRSIASGYLSAEAGMPTLKPSQYFWASAQYSRVNDYYKAIEINHNLSSSGRCIANVNIEKPIKSTVRMIRILEDSVNSLNKNPNNMHDVLVYLIFDNTTGITSLGDLEITNGKLRLQTGKATGTMTTDIATADSNLSHFEARAKVNDDCDSSTFQVSNTGGSSYNDSNKNYNLVGDRNTAIAFTTTGKTIRVKITLTQDADNLNPECDGFCLLVRRA